MSHDNNSIACRVILIGESRVGKSDIVPSIKTHDFNSWSTCSGVNYISKTLEVNENQYVKFDIWDSVIYQSSLPSIFYRDASVCILVYDIINKFTFNELKNYWIKEVKENCPKDISN